MPSKTLFAKTVQFYVFMGSLTSSDINQDTDGYFSNMLVLVF